MHLLTTGHRYSAAWEHWQSAKDVGALIEGIAKAGYATSGGYATLVRQIAEGPRVAGAITDARTA